MLKENIHNFEVQKYIHEIFIFALIYTVEIQFILTKVEKLINYACRVVP